MLKEISVYDVPNTRMVPDGYDMKDMPIATDDNIAYLIEEHNKLVQVLNGVCKWLNIDPSELVDPNL